MKLCIIYNFAQHYRLGIFKCISEAFDCDFLFGDSMSDVRKLDYGQLRGSVTETHTHRLHGGWSWQPGVVSLLSKPYTHYIILGDTRSLSTWSFCLLSRLFYRDKMVYFWSHGWYGKETRIERILKKVFFRLPNGGVFLYGNYARKLMIQEGFKPEKLFTIHNSLDYERQVIVRNKLNKTDIYSSHFLNPGYNLVFIGRLTRVKKLDMVIQAIKLCQTTGFQVNCTFVGDGTEANKLRSLVNDLGLNDCIWFYGPCYEEEKIGELIYNADACVSPGNVGLTAMHCLVYGTPVITHNRFSSQMPEFEAVVEGVTGSFFEYGSVNSLSLTIKKWLSEKGSVRETIRRNCFDEIDSNWNPDYQIRVIKEQLTKKQ